MEQENLVGCAWASWYYHPCLALGPHPRFPQCQSRLHHQTGSNLRGHLVGDWSPIPRKEVPGLLLPGIKGGVEDSPRVRSLSPARGYLPGPACWATSPWSLALLGGSMSERPGM